MNKKICFGCGVTLQFTKEDKLGYSPKEEAKYCKRCFRMTHYGKDSNNLSVKDPKDIIANINKSAQFTVFLTDFLSINKEVISSFKSIKGKKMLLISKYDLIKDTLKENYILNILRNNYEIDTDIKFISSYTNYKLKEVINYLYKLPYDSIYIVGASNSGKSTLINKIIDETETKLNKTTTSKTLNTTIDFIRVPLNGGLTIIDSPGLTLGGNVLLNKKIVKRTYQMKSGETLKIDNMYLNSSNETLFVLYLKENIDVKKYFKEITFDEKLDILDKTDFIIKEYGYIHITNKTTLSIKNISSYEVR